MSLYEDLGVPPDADAGAIKHAHRARVNATHPDRGGDAEEFRKASHAYLVLRDPEKRDRYDRTGEHGDGVENPLAAVAEILMPAFDAAINENLANLEYVDLVQIARRKIAESIDGLRTKVRDAHQIIANIGRVRAKLSYAGAGPDIVSGTLDQRMKMMSQTITALEKSIAHHERASELAKAYAWARMEAPQFVGFATSSSTTTGYR